MNVLSKAVASLYDVENKRKELINSLAVFEKDMIALKNSILPIGLQEAATRYHLCDSDSDSMSGMPNAIKKVLSEVDQNYCMVADVEYDIQELEYAIKSAISNLSVLLDKNKEC